MLEPVLPVMSDTKIRWDEYPYPARRVPVLAAEVVATSQPLAVQAGMDMLRRGGNAVDAALASAAALSVVEPCSNGLGSDLIAMVWDGATLHGLNASGRAPAAWPGAQGAVPITTGWNSITVPGAVDAWARLSRRFGRLDFDRLLAPAVAYAEHGYPVSPTVQGRWRAACETYRAYPGFARYYCPHGRPPRIGELFRSPGLATTLRRIAASYGEDFYHGRTAQRTIAFLRQGGCAMAADDLAAHRSQWTAPISAAFGAQQLFEMPPNTQGVAALIALRILEHAGIGEYRVDSAPSIHLQVEAMKAALCLTTAEVADPGHMRVSIAALLDERRLREIAAGIDPRRASQPRAVRGDDGGTVYIASGDRDGMMVSLIQSNFWGFGSGIVDPQTGISFQNRAAGFSLEPGHPNQAAAGKRPFNTIIPGFVMHAGRPLMSFGVMGGHMQAQGHVQMMVRIFCHGQNPQAAADAPRWYVDEAWRLVLEDGFDPRLARALAARGHCFGEPSRPSVFGGAQLVYRLDNGHYAAASDHRKDGHAAGC